MLINISAHAEKTIAAIHMFMTILIFILFSSAQSDATFDPLIIDEGNTSNYQRYSVVNGESSFSVDLDISIYSIGYHTLGAVLSDGSIVYYTKAFPRGIYDEIPTIKANSDFFTVGSNYICFRPYFTVQGDNDTDPYGLYVQLNDGSSWGDVYGPFTSYTYLKLSYFKGSTKIKANTTYKLRCFYAKETTYASDNYWIYSDFSNTVSIKTGNSKKVAIKSISAKCLKQEKKELHVSGYWDGNGNWHSGYDTTVWATTVKVTIKLKSKPNAAGIMVDNYRIKGNKKKYTLKITQSGKLKGQKTKFSICSYNSASVGALSPSVTKTVKIK